jgi:hypothetical protein
MFHENSTTPIAGCKCHPSCGTCGFLPAGSDESNTELWPTSHLECASCVSDSFEHIVVNNVRKTGYCRPRGVCYEVRFSPSLPPGYRVRGGDATLTPPQARLQAGGAV